MVLTILLCGVMILELTWCNNTEKYDIDDIHTFKGTIIECGQKSMIVQPNESEAEFKSSDKFRIEYVDGFNSCNVGDKVKITYKGMINESYPAQIYTTKIKTSKNLEKISNYTKTIDDYIIEMNIPNEWHYEELPLEENYKFALKINKNGNNDYFVLYYLNNPFGVCGTGRNVQELKLDNGKIAKIGYYNTSKTWSDISFQDDNPNIVLENNGTEDNDVFPFIKTIDIKKTN